MRLGALALAFLSVLACGSSSSGTADGASADAVAAADGGVKPDGGAAVDGAGEDIAAGADASSGAAADTGADADTSPFTGVWQYSSGTMTITCQGYAPMTSQVAGTLMIDEGISSSLVIVTPTCTLKITPSGSSAVFDPAGQICPPVPGVDANGVAYTETDTYTAGSLIVEGITATLAETGTAQLVGGGAIVTCTFTSNGTLNKVAK